jgi:hypothetical protein
MLLNKFYFLALKFDFEKIFCYGFVAKRCFEGRGRQNKGG